MTLEKRVERIEEALSEIRNEVAMLNHRLDTGGFAAFRDGTALGRSMRNVLEALKALDESKTD